MSVDPEDLATRPFRVNTDGDVEMAENRTFNANGSQITSLGAPAAADSAARAQDCKSHLFVTSTGTVTVNAALFAANLLGPGSTHLFVRFTGSGVKTLQLADDFDSAGLLVTVFKNDDASSIVVECIGTSPPTILGQAGPLELQPTIAESRSFSLAASGNDFRFVGLPRIAGAVETAFLADDAVTTDKLDDGAVTTEKIASTALDGWGFGASPAVPTPTAAEHAVRKDYVDDYAACYENSLSGNPGSSTAPFTLGTATFNTLGATVVSGEIEVPAGEYDVEFGGSARPTTGSADASAQLSLDVGGSSVATVTGDRVGSNNAIRLAMSRSKRITITTPASQRLRVTRGGNAVELTGGWIKITRVKR